MELQLVNQHFDRLDRSGDRLATSDERPSHNVEMAPSSLYLDVPREYQTKTKSTNSDGRSWRWNTGFRLPRPRTTTTRDEEKQAVMEVEVGTSAVQSAITRLCPAPGCQLYLCEDQQAIAVNGMIARATTPPALDDESPARITERLTGGRTARFTRSVGWSVGWSVGLSVDVGQRGLLAQASSCTTNTTICTAASASAAAAAAVAVSIAIAIARTPDAGRAGGRADGPTASSPLLCGRFSGGIQPNASRLRLPTDARWPLSAASSSVVPSFVRSFRDVEGFDRSIAGKPPYHRLQSSCTESCPDIFPRLVGDRFFAILFSFRIFLPAVRSGERQSYHAISIICTQDTNGAATSTRIVLPSAPSVRRLPKRRIKLRSS
ncbi:unnamed protein product [Soboliphyme baturini]|uniref:Uncharacterized protein n=1 Tax=Soboliphyme baturini TaxID=241478 RepID=A0A183IX42_9BILA|nr:unnamed protein product [Soboliphyme baturini]